MMTKESLDSDRVNYLVWRYLLESDYLETALRLQKEWNIEDPQQLPFAPHVTNHALVAVLNRGLLYNASEREFALAVPNGAGPVSGFFGPLTPTSPTANEVEFENARKRQIDDEQPQIQLGAAVKRPRLSNGYENGFDPTAMDIDDDQNGDGHAYPSPEQLPSPILATNGPETGTQIDKVTELSTETTFLDLSDDTSARNTVLLQCEWNPRDPTILAAAGTDALARIWTVSRPATDLTAHADLPVFPPHRNILEAGLPPSTTATGLSWTSDGAAIVIASEPVEDGTASIEVCSTDGLPIASFEDFESPVICLRWNPSNDLFLALSPEKDGTLVTVMSPSSRGSLRYFITGHALIEQPLDAAWTSRDEFILCGGDFLQALHVADGGIFPVRKYETREGHSLSKVTFDMHSRLLATATDTGMIDVWDQQGQRHTFNAHQGLITSLIWQPMQIPAAIGDNAERLLASAGEDGAISIWNARSSETKSRRSMTMGSGVVALAFTPDGAFIAGATGERILIWKVDDVNIPRATWTRGSELGWQTPLSNDSTPDEDQHCLCWDANGQKLAYGVNSLLAVINFRP